MARPDRRPPPPAEEPPSDILANGGRKRDKREVVFPTYRTEIPV